MSDWPFIQNIGCRVYASGATGTTSGALKAIPLDTERYDTASMHQTSTSALTGTVTKTASSVTVTGSGTLFTSELVVGQLISVPGTAVEQRVVSAIASDTSLTVASAFANTASGQTATRRNTGIVFPVAGIYLVTAHAAFASNASGVRAIEIMLNSTGLDGTGGTILADDQRPPVSGDITVVSMATLYKFAQWDYVEMIAYQSSGGALNVNVGANYSSELAAHYLSAG